MLLGHLSTFFFPFDFDGQTTLIYSSVHDLVSFFHSSFLLFPFTPSNPSIFWGWGGGGGGGRRRGLLICLLVPWYGWTMNERYWSLNIWTEANLFSFCVKSCKKGSLPRIWIRRGKKSRAMRFIRPTSLNSFPLTLWPSASVKATDSGIK